MSLTPGCRLRSSFVFLLLIVSALSGCSGEAPEPALSDDWAGWIYLQGSDLPVRARLSAEDSLLDLPHLQRFGLPLTVSDPAADPDAGPDSAAGSAPATLVLEAVLGENGLRFEVTDRTPTVLTGRFLFGESAEGEFWLHRSALPLDRGDPEPRTACAGTYRFPSGRTIVVSRRAWNELRYLDLSSGRQATLFATSDSTFFAGAAEYVPTEVAVRVECLDRESESPRLLWNDGQSDPEEGRPTRLEEREVAFLSQGAELSGTVLLPEGVGAHPGIVVLGGSDWTTRANVRNEAELIAAAGVAVLIYDQRGYGASGGEAAVPFSVTAADAASAAGVLRALPEVRSDAVGVSARSRGAWVAPIAAAEAGVFDFVLAFVASGRSPAEQETYRRLGALEATGASAAELREARSYLELMYSWLATGQGWEAYRAALDGISDPWFEILGGADTPDPEVWRWSLLNAHTDPFPAWERVTVPVLAIFGEGDRSVETAVSAPRIRAALARAGNTDVEIVVVPEVDHSLRLGWSLPAHMRPGYGPEVWSTVHGWLGRVGG